MADQLIHLINGEAGRQPALNEFWSEAKVVPRLLRREPERLPSPGFPDVDSVCLQSATLMAIAPHNSRRADSGGHRPPGDSSRSNGPVCASATVWRGRAAEHT